MATEEIEISELEFTEELASDNLIPVESSTDTKATSLQILKNWLSSFFVDKTSNEDVGGTKNFLNICNFRNTVYFGSQVDATNPPTSGYKYTTTNWYRDKVGTVLGTQDVYKTNIDTIGHRLNVRRTVDGVGKSGNLSIEIDKTGLAVGRAPTPPQNSNGMEIVTTEWANTFCKETNKIVVEAKQTGDSWYRKYSDGWIEQGGRAPVGTGEITVNLVKPMKDGNYSLICTANFSSATAISYIGRYTTNFKAVRSANTIFTWEVRGYGA